MTDAAAVRSGCREVGLRVPFGPGGECESEAGTALVDPGERGPHGRLQRLKSGKSNFLQQKIYGDFCCNAPAQRERKRDKFQIDSLFEECLFRFGLDLGLWQSG